VHRRLTTAEPDVVVNHIEWPLPAVATRPGLIAWVPGEDQGRSGSRAVDRPSRLGHELSERLW
jgi:hypothetical protein